MKDVARKLLQEKAYLEWENPRRGPERWKAQAQAQAQAQRTERWSRTPRCPSRRRRAGGSCQSAGPARRRIRFIPSFIPDMTRSGQKPTNLTARILSEPAKRSADVLLAALSNDQNDGNYLKESGGRRTEVGGEERHWVHHGDRPSRTP
jgi:hypothetical protein